MIHVSVLAVRPHPEQATNNPHDWAVQLLVTYLGTKRTFWRWYHVRETPTRPPTHDEIITRFWSDTFAELHGFDFEAG